ncbi:Anthranilate synthase component 2 (plasmid) [Buchnera aphidicola (Thelaxes suberi)]|uniref:aminodeoxychorismate/anthranilate synthase component II n=1 Tax=Buchnera aphidicola TaxID=9 RepID=UPI003463D83E
MTNILFIDNFDSFLYNFIDLLRIKNHNVIIFRNNTCLKVIEKFIRNFNDPIIILSPGPGAPKNAGCMNQIIKNFKGKIPIIGVCLGFQALIESYGGIIKPAEPIMHGKASLIHHDKKAMFSSIPNPFLAGRYHSLMGANIPDTLIINAFCEKVPMAIRNDDHLVYGFQFHPESILTSVGSKIVENTINWINKNKKK